MLANPLKANSEYTLVPILALHVVKQRAESAGRNFDTIGFEMDSYWITPEDCRAGGSARRLSFTEAVNMMII